MALTKAQRARLDKLATYLEGLPKNYRHFDMTRWITDGWDDDAVVEYARRNGGVQHCGTAACAAGHGPAAGILVPPRFVDSGWVDWSEYACELFAGGDYSTNVWLFGGNWRRSDNHHWGAAARIRYVLEHGEPPKGFYGSPGRKWRNLYAAHRIDAKAKADA